MGYFNWTIIHAEEIKALITAVAIVIAGFWSYLLFVKNRQKYPRVEVRHEILHKPISEEEILLHVKTIIENKGHVLLPLTSSITRVQQVLPLCDDIEKCINDGIDPVKQGDTKCQWPYLFEREKIWEKNKCEIEPGETQHVFNDFIIEKDVQAVSIYSYCKNESKGKRNIGWSTQTIYDIA